MNRLAPCPGDDACELSRIEIDFAIPVYMTQAQQQRLLELIDELVNAPCNQLEDGVHWVAQIGAKPSFSKADAALLGKPAEPGAPDSGEPTFDDEVYHVATCARGFVNERERERELRKRGEIEVKRGT